MNSRSIITSIVVPIVFLFIFVAGQAAAQTDTVRIVCVGNSITEGYTSGNPALDAYPPQLQSLLGPGYLVFNAGVSGRTLLRHGDFPEWNEQKFKDGLNFRPTIVTISLGTHDSKPYNWTDTLKSQFIPDYEAMVDTFKNLPSHPQVWLCLPPPAFSGAFDIRDSVIDADIIPMIRQVAATKGCRIVDFNTLLLPYSKYIPDGIHPNTIGLSIMAEYLYGEVAGKTVRRVVEENCVLNKPVTASGTIDAAQFGGDKLVDGSPATQWVATGFPSQAVIDLGAARTVDLFRVDFAAGAEANAGYQFKIETSADAGTWTTMLDRTSRADSATTVLEKTDSVSARYVRIVVTGAARPRGDTVSVADVRVLAANGSAHTPVITLKRTGGSASMPRYDVRFQWPNGAKGNQMLYRDKNFAGPAPMSGFRTGATYTQTYEYIKPTDYVKYYAVTFADGVETVSDTLYAGTTPTGIRENGSGNVPTGYRLEPSYPNPFNPSTTITFSIPIREKISLKIVDVNGKDVATIVDGELAAGTYTNQWIPASNASGVYFCRLTAGTFVETKKLVLLK